MKGKQGGDPISLSDIECIICEARADAEIDAQIKRALESGDDALALKLVRQLYELPEETRQ